VTEKILCPSARCREGALLIGVQGEERLGFVTPPLPLDRDFIERATRDGRPEQRFRFAEPCLEKGCRQWTGSACGVIERIGQAEAPAELPECGIRPRCRWFAQQGPRACGVCPYVLTDNRASLEPMSLSWEGR
jgi:hypothetical protein